MRNITYIFFRQTIQVNVDEALREGAPRGVDCFFDNVGGKDATVVINNHMNQFGRISCCGAISIYNEKEPPMIPSIQGSMVFKVCFGNLIQI